MKTKEPAAEDITAGIKTFMRPKRFKNCLAHVIRAGIKKVMVGYDGPDELREEHMKICENVPKDIDVIFIKSKFNAGLSRMRNKMVERTETDYFLLLDDDMYIQNNVLETLSFLPKHEDIPGIGFPMLYESIYPTLDAFDWVEMEGYLVRVPSRDKTKEYFNGNVFLYPFDYIPNCAIYKTEFLRIFPWDENYIIGNEHGDFFMNIKRNSDLRFACCMNQFAIHDQGSESDEFSKYRFGNDVADGMRYFFAKWGLKDEVPPFPRFFHGGYDARVSATLITKARQIWIDRVLNKRKLDDPVEVGITF